MEIKLIIKNIVTSILVFLSISFLTVIKCLMTIYETGVLKIGFPMTFYKGFLVSDGIRFSWDIVNMSFNYIIILFITIGFRYVFKYFKSFE